MGRDRFALLSLCLATGAGASVQPGPGPLPAEPWPRFLPGVEHTTIEGLPDNSVSAIAFDGRARAYVATPSGVGRYDGATWERIELPGAGVSTAAFALVHADDGQIYIGTLGQGLWRIDPTTDQAHFVGLRDHAVVDLVADQGQVLAASARDGVHRCSLSACQQLAGTAGLAVARVLPGLGPEGPCLWLGLVSDGLRRLDGYPDAPRLSAFQLQRSDGLPNQSVRSLAQWGETAPGDLWIGVGRGLARLNVASGALIQYDHLEGFPGQMSFALTNQIQPDRLLLGARPGGLFEFGVDGRWRRYSSLDGLPDNEVFSLGVDSAADRPPRLWVGTVASGAFQIDPGRWFVFDEQRGLPARETHGVGIARFPDGEALWVGTSAGLVRYRAGHFELYLPSAGPARAVNTVISTPDGLLYIGDDEKLIRIGPDGRREYTAHNSDLPALGADVLLYDDSNGKPRVYVGTGHGLAVVEPDGELRELPIAPGDEPAIRDLQLVPAVGNRPARIAVASSKGMWWFDPDSEGLSAADCGELGSVMSLAWSDGLLWMGTDRGLANHAVATGHCSWVQDLADERVLGLLFRTATQLFVFSHRGVAELSLAGAQPTVVRRFDDRDGLPSLHFENRVAVDPEGRIYAATRRGLVALDPARIQSPDPPSALELVVRNTSGQTLRSDAVVAESQASLQLNYRLQSLALSHRIRYRSQVLGLDVAPTPWQAVRSRELPRLPEGRYRILVEATDGYGTAAPAAEFSLKVEAPWWRRPWAWVLYLLAAIGLGLAAGRWRAHAYAARARALEGLVEARTRELAQANESLRLAALTDPLTGLGNRRQWRQSAEAELATAQTERRDHRGALLVTVDADHFKRINDTHGHGVGDEVLVALAQRLRSVLRGGDLAARIGGEEFLLLIRALEPIHHDAFLKRLHSALRAPPIPTAAGALAVTCSLGAIGLPLAAGWPTLTLDQATELADLALYRAKHGGRDRTVLAVPDPAGEAVLDGRLRVSFELCSGP